jgi:hypothetical protein
VISPILSNIYLSKLDAFAETVLMPQYTRGERRKENLEYRKAHYRLTRARQEGNRAKARQYQRQARTLPFGDPSDPGYRRLRYSRYADDHLPGFTGPKAEAEDIKDQLARFLRDELKLELSPDKTLVTHARTRAARYPGYEITVQHADRKITRGRAMTPRPSPYAARPASSASRRPVRCATGRSCWPGSVPSAGSPAAAPPTPPGHADPRGRGHAGVQLGPG